MNRTALRLGAAALMVLVAACSHQTSSTYNATEVGRVLDTSKGVVLSSRVVDISGQGEQSGYGPLVGAASGASAGYYISQSTPGRIIAGVLGGLIGAGLGWAAEEHVDSRQGIEYVLRLDGGQEVTVVQNRASDETPLAAGTHVLIQRGGDYARVLPAPVTQ